MVLSEFGAANDFETPTDRTSGNDQRYGHVRG